MTVGRVLFTKLIVADMAAGIAFYERAFGFAVQNRIEAPGLEEVMLGLPGDRFTLILYRHTDGRALAAGDRHGPLGLSTQDIDAAWARAIEAGARAVTPPQSFPGLKFAFLDDPEGHPLELVQYDRPDASQGASA
jgi:predicted enzyme related to lactoylglutathione lyase